MQSNMVSNAKILALLDDLNVTEWTSRDSEVNMETISSFKKIIVTQTVVCYLKVISRFRINFKTAFWVQLIMRGASFGGGVLWHDILPEFWNTNIY